MTSWCMSVFVLLCFYTLKLPETTRISYSAYSGKKFFPDFLMKSQHSHTNNKWIYEPKLLIGLSKKLWPTPISTVSVDHPDYLEYCLFSMHKLSCLPFLWVGTTSYCELTALNVYQNCLFWFGISDYAYTFLEVALLVYILFVIALCSSSNRDLNCLLEIFLPCLVFIMTSQAYFLLPFP